MQVVISSDKRTIADRPVPVDTSLAGGEGLAGGAVPVSICLLGLTFDSPNLGVQALLDGSVRSILSACPGAKISVLDYGYDSFSRSARFGDRTADIEFVNLRFSKKLFLPNNIALLMVIATLLKCVPRRFRTYFTNKNETLRKISQLDMAAAISGGDSFSDIYGLGRLLYEALPQILVLTMGKRLILLPQTLGPFKGRVARIIAKYIMSRADVVFSRDEFGLKETERLLGPGNAGKLQFCHDVGFLVQPIPPSTADVQDLQSRPRQGQLVIGFNISGLLYAGGYTGKNMFGLKVGYRDLVHQVLNLLIEQIKARVVLVPHVYGERTVQSVESDQAACETIYQALPPHLKESVILLRGTYTVNEIKHLIGMFDVFIGSRMHSCIAALSQAVPAVAISYSDKFAGVLQTLNMGGLIADPRQMSIAEILAVISQTIERRDQLRRELTISIPAIQQNVASTLGKAMFAST